MKKTLISLSLIGFLAAALFVPVVALGLTGPPVSCEIRAGGVGLPTECPPGTCAFDSPTQPCGMCCLLNTVYNVTDWIFVALIVLTTLFVILGAFKILTAKDSAEEVTKGRQYIMFAALGLLVAFLAKAVPQIVKVASGF
ncbi:MAG: hypothetical protein NTZ84_01885 [Candidatus Nealsonbacteria bacterium]|nr:hypothetical protein [Candidatus Nealsonbacteria bacterium]